MSRQSVRKALPRLDQLVATCDDSTDAIKVYLGYDVESLKDDPTKLINFITNFKTEFKKHSNLCSDTICALYSNASKEEADKLKELKHEIKLESKELLACLLCHLNTHGVECAFSNLGSETSSISENFPSSSSLLKPTLPSNFKQQTSTAVDFVHPNLINSDNIPAVSNDTHGPIHLLDTPIQYNIGYEFSDKSKTLHQELFTIDNLDLGSCAASESARVNIPTSNNLLTMVPNTGSASVTYGALPNTSTGFLQQNENVNPNSLIDGFTAQIDNLNLTGNSRPKGPPITNTRIYPNHQTDNYANINDISDRMYVTPAASASAYRTPRRHILSENTAARPLTVGSAPISHLPSDPAPRCAERHVSYHQNNDMASFIPNSHISHPPAGNAPLPSTQLPIYAPDPASTFIVKQQLFQKAPDPFSGEPHKFNG